MSVSVQYEHFHTILYNLPAKKLRQGNVFIPVCDSVRQAGGTHPTGMHSCYWCLDVGQCEQPIRHNTCFTVLQINNMNEIFNEVLLISRLITN